MKPGRVLAITIRILQQFRRDRRTLALLFVAPLVILGSFYFLLRGGGQQPEVGVVVQDSGSLGGAIAAKLQASDLVRARSMDLATAQTQVRDSKIAGYVLFGPSFTADVVSAHVVAPEVHLEGSQPGPSQTVIAAVTQATAAGLATLASNAGAPQLKPRIVYEYGGPGLDTLDYFGAAFIGLVVFFLVFVITSVSFLRERSQGTLERLFASPLRRGEIVLGYMLGFTVVALAQAALVLVFSLYVLRIHNSGSVLLIFLLELLLAVAAVNLGIFLSTFARTEFQAVQFIPLVVVPQVLLSGVMVPVASEPQWMQVISNVLPLTYAVNGLRDIMIKGADLGWSSLQIDGLVVLGFCVVLVAAAATTLQRRVA
ncbi:MAG: ABC transporter permease [Candidatus Dormiibacterota bacterium]